MISPCSLLVSLPTHRDSRGSFLPSFAEKEKSQAKKKEKGDIINTLYAFIHLDVCSQN